MVNYLRAILNRCRDERGVALLATMLAIALMTLIVVDFTSASALGYSARRQPGQPVARGLSGAVINQCRTRVVGAGLASESVYARKLWSDCRRATLGLADERVGRAVSSGPDQWRNGQPSIVDEARKFNINNILNPENGEVNPRGVEQFTRLMGLLGMPPDLVPAIVDWLDRDSIDMPGGAEADYYLRLIPPYEPRNGPMPTIGDLRMVRGVDDATFLRLRDYLTVMPEPLVNVNTAPGEVIACMEPELTANLRLTKQILLARDIKPFKDLGQVVTDVPGLGFNRYSS